MKARNWKPAALGVFVFLLVAGAWTLAKDPPTRQQRRDALNKLFQQGNFKEAYDGLRLLALDPKDEPLMVGAELELAIQALRRLGRVDEIDEFREAVIAAHSTNWRLLATAAQTYIQGEHHGFIVAGKFYRGNKRGGTRYVGTMQRDRTRALQLLTQALPLTKKENDKNALARFHLQYANTLLSGAGSHEPWRLQYLTDLSKLPDYDEGGRFWYRGQQPAPVDEKGNPVFYYLPKAYDQAQNDGERWRWNLVQAVEYEPNLANEIDMKFADFLRSQFGVQTMSGHRGRFGRGFGGPVADEPAGDPKTGPFAVQTLEENETIAKLASGVKRFRLPDEFNWLKIYQRVAGRGKTVQGEQALSNLAQVFENRRQYPKAADVWRRAITEYGAGANNFRQNRLDQIVGNWGRFEPGKPQPASAQAVLDFRFRNGAKVAFEAHAIHVAKLLEDVKVYLASNPGRIDWQKTNIGNIGYRLVEQQLNQYVGKRVASWNVDLKPLPKHYDRLVTIKTPMKEPGAYLVTATMAGGNVSRIIVWVSDTVILKKQLDGQVFYYVADAVNGRPVAKADVEFFGWRQEPVQPNRNEYRVVTTRFTQPTDADGQIILGPGKQPVQHQWLITARQPRSGAGGADRFAYLGYTSVWFNRQYDPEYNATRVFAITDRPVYRPEQSVQFKLWVRHAKYDQPEASSFAGRTFTVRIHNPKSEKVYEKELTADAYGGLAGELALPRDATLGVYNVSVIKLGGNLGGGSFRVEEYKKPEFEVVVEAPKEPVRLGEHVVATITAKYYFGAPVTQAKVKYKVLRTTHTTEWYPHGAWDWLYGPGYWWFAPDYAWYPGFGDWGCCRPALWWMPRPSAPPEVVLDGEAPIGPDGVLKIAIDTLPAKELHGNRDHKYSITAEVVDASRRTIVGTGAVLATRKPFEVFAWVDRGHYRTGQTVKAHFRAQTADGKPIEGKGALTLYRITYENAQPIETKVESWKLDTDAQGTAKQQLEAAKPGQYRLAYKVTDAKDHTVEGGYLFVVRGEGFTGANYRFNALELITDQKEYQPGAKVKLMVNTNQKDGTVLLFLRPTNGVYQAPKILRLKGKSTEQEIAVVQRDMPNFFVEAVTIFGGQVHSEVREVVVPPEKRVLNVAIEPSAQEYKPGQKATVKVRLTDFNGKPYAGSTVVSIYDRSVEYISGGSNVPEIKAFYWKWRRSHHPHTESSLGRYFGNLVRRGEHGMGNLGVFGGRIVDEFAAAPGGRGGFGGGFGGAPGGGMPPPNEEGGMADRGPAEQGAEARSDGKDAQLRREQQNGQAGGEPPLVQPTVRKNFADTAYWSAALQTDKDGRAEITLTMPENLTAWKIRVWAMGHGTRVGQGEAIVTTKKDLIVRLQAPRFFVEKDEVVLSANVHNYLKNEKNVRVQLELEGGTLAALDEATRQVKIASGGEQRVDWRVKVVKEGQAVVRMKALTDEDSDAMEMRFPCYVHGMLKTESYTGVIRSNQNQAKVTLKVPAERRVNETVLEVRYSPTLAGAMVDALPYLVEYPYGCTEQTLNRFLPTVITQNILVGMKLDLKEIQKHRTNLNSQEIGNDKERIAKGWKRYKREPVFDVAEVKAMSRAGVQALAGMQCSDGGWGWFSGHGERSFPHTTAVVVHGLQLAKQNGVDVPRGMIERGIAWLKAHQDEQVRQLQNAPLKVRPWKERASEVDALVYMVLIDQDVASNDMMDFLYRDRTHIAVYAKAMFGLALHKQRQQEKLDMILRNIGQYVVQDAENQTAYLRLPANNPWWYWYGSENEANAYYLKLLARTNPKDERASGLVKYLLNNRRHATYWNSTRDTAVCIEAMADYLKASGEDRPDMTVEVWLDGKKHKDVKIDASNLFSFDNKLVLVGDAVETGKHVLELKRRGTGPVYFNAYLTNFTLEDFITRAGLEVRVNRKYYKLTRADEKVKVRGGRGQAADQRVEKYTRTELANLATLKSGDLVEVELEIDSKNDYEYLIFEDPKAAGFEPMQVRSGYTNDGLGAYMELRDEKVCFFVRRLPRGKHSVSYRMRAEIPGRFSALPTRAYAMYAPELKGNSDEIKLRIQD